MNHMELKVARVRRGLYGKTVASALGLTTDGYFKKEYGTAKFTLSDAFTLTKLMNLSLQEFVTIFFDGDLPFLYDSDRDCKFREKAFPLKEARCNANFTAQQVALALGMSEDNYIQREKGKVRISLEHSAVLSKMFGLSLIEFNDVFFRSQLPYRKSDLALYGNIIPQKAGEINAEASNNSTV